eukprot:SAG31_NODE_4113_length_3572_cov_24.306939_3_plen_290_part_00
MQELHVAEQDRQREHQMMTAQIDRTHRGLDQCCRPVINDLIAMSYIRQPMVRQIVGKLEPDLVEEMLSLANGAIMTFDPDGAVMTRSTKKVYWTPNPPAELTRAMGEHTFASATGAACLIATHDVFVAWSKPFCFEMPSAILKVISAEPTGEVAEMYRNYVRRTLMPLSRRIVDTLREHAAYVELPTKDWLEKTFPEMSWRTNTNTIFVQHWYTHTLSFERILSQWSDGNFGSVRPDSAQPLGGMLQMLNRSQEQAEVRQAELIGMTSVNEFDYGNVFARVESNQADSS